MDAATDAADEADLKLATEKLKEAIADLEKYDLSAKTAEGIALLKETLAHLEADGGMTTEFRKTSRYRTMHSRKMSDSMSWTASSRALSMTTRIDIIPDPEPE